MAEGDIEALLATHDFRASAVADALGIGINTVRRKMAALDLPRPRDLAPESIENAIASSGTVEAAARALRVSQQGLKLRMAELGLHR